MECAGRTGADELVLRRPALPSAALRPAPAARPRDGREPGGSRRILADTPAGRRRRP
jgi:hypothetical protein